MVSKSSEAVNVPKAAISAVNYSAVTDTSCPSSFEQAINAIKKPSKVALLKISSVNFIKQKVNVSNCRFPNYLLT
jgi:hypothetical protein